MLGVAEKTLGIAEKCLEEPKSAQKRRNAARQSSNVHISEVSYLWATVLINYSYYIFILFDFTNIYLRIYQPQFIILHIIFITKNVCLSVCQQQLINMATP